MVTNRAEGAIRKKTAHTKSACGKQTPQANVFFVFIRCRTIFLRFSRQGLDIAQNLEYNIEGIKLGSKPKMIKNIKFKKEEEAKHE